jgi:hypothetical protein
LNILKEEHMRIERLLAALIALAAMTAGAAGIAAQTFMVEGQPLSAADCAVLAGGETWVDVDARRTVAVVTSIPRDTYGMDYSRATSYTVPVKNEVTTRDQPGTNDVYTPAPFPSGSATMTVKPVGGDATRAAKYGGTSGEWITTDASRTVTAYPIGPDGKADKTRPYTRQDWGYFWHANNATSFKDAVTAGCLLSPKNCLDRVISTLKADRGGKRITVH